MVDERKLQTEWAADTSLISEAKKVTIVFTMYCPIVKSVISVSPNNRNERSNI